MEDMDNPTQKNFGESNRMKRVRPKRDGKEVDEVEHTAHKRLGR